MIELVKTPNLPHGEVASLICGTDDENILNFFKSKEIEVIKNECNLLIDNAVSTHADMAALLLDDKRIIIDKNQIKLKEKLIESGFYVLETSDEISGEYPKDIVLNFALFGKYAMGNFDFVDAELRNALTDKVLLNVKQGYCKCSVLVLKENAIITDDVSIHRIASENGVESLLVEKGDVTLKGHEYGFIGGASGKISENEVVFFGDITRHRNFKEIDDFIRRHNLSYVCSDRLPLRDIGGIVPLSVKTNY